MRGRHAAGVRDGCENVREGRKEDENSDIEKKDRQKKIEI